MLFGHPLLLPLRVLTLSGAIEADFSGVRCVQELRELIARVKSTPKHLIMLLGEEGRELTDNEALARVAVQVLPVSKECQVQAIFFPDEDLVSTDPVRRESAARSYGPCGPAAAHKVAPLLDDSTAEVRVAATAALADMGVLEAHAEKICGLFCAGRRQERWALLGLLSGLGAHSKRVEGLLCHTCPRRRLDACRGLLRMGLPWGSDTAGVVAGLRLGKAGAEGGGCDCVDCTAGGGEKAALALATEVEEILQAVALPMTDLLLEGNGALNEMGFTRTQVTETLLHTSCDLDETTRQLLAAIMGLAGEVDARVRSLVLEDAWTRSQLADHAQLEMRHFHEQGERAAKAACYDPSYWEVDSIGDASGSDDESGEEADGEEADDEEAPTRAAKAPTVTTTEAPLKAGGAASRPRSRSRSRPAA